MFGQIQYNENDMVAEEKGQILSIQKVGERCASHTIPIPASYHNTLSFKKGIQYFIEISSLKLSVFSEVVATMCDTAILQLSASPSSLCRQILITIMI